MKTTDPDRQAQGGGPCVWPAANGTFPSATAAGLAKGNSVAEAVRATKEYVTAAISAAYPIGGGHGPLNHFYGLRSDSGR